jgi:lysozyme
VKINDAGLALIKRAEGLRLDSYRDAVGIATIGYGHTGPDVRIPMTITPGEAERLLYEDLAR